MFVSQQRPRLYAVDRIARDDARLWLARQLRWERRLRTLEEVPSARQRAC